MPDNEKVSAEDSVSTLQRAIDDLKAAIAGFRAAGAKTNAELKQMTWQRDQLFHEKLQRSVEPNAMDAYQDATGDSAVYPGHDYAPGGVRFTKTLPYLVLGLNGEAGEVADMLKKMLRNDEPLARNPNDAKLKEELGDVLWYVARIAAEKGWSLQDVADTNIAKLKARKEAGELKKPRGQTFGRAAAPAHVDHQPN